MSTPSPIPQPSLVEIDPAAFTSTASSSSLWDRISSWASEHKAIVYTIAGATLVVTAAGVYYYVSDVEQSSNPASPSSGKKKAKKRKSKKEGESPTAKDTQGSSTSKSASVVSGDVENELEDFTEEFVASLTEQVRRTDVSHLGQTLK
jgi:import receptor subunit TOM70